MSACDIQRLQTVKNAAACLFDGMSKYDSGQPVLRDVQHWLPVRERANFKIALLAYKAFNGQVSSYLSDMLVPVSMNPAFRRNSSADRGDLAIPCVINTSYGGKQLYYCRPDTVEHSAV